MKVFGKKIFYKCCAVSLSMTLMLGCGAKPDSTEGISETVEASTETDELLEELSISLLADDVSEESVNKVKDSWKHLSEIVPLSDIEIAIGPSSRHEKREGLICFTELEIGSDDFNVIFTDKCTDLPYWKTVGLSEYAFDYAPVNSENQVKEYLEAREEEYFPLFAISFSEKYATESDIQLSGDCAYYLTKYVLDMYSYSEFAANDYRGEWLNSLGSDKMFRFDEIDEVVEAATAEKEGTYINAQCGGNKWELFDVSWLSSADDVYELFYNAEKGIQDLSRRIASESDILDEDSFRRDVTITTTDSSRASFANNGKIVLFSPEHFLHEYVHCTLGYDDKEIWLVEGLAEYYSMDYKNGYYSNYWDENFHNEFDLGIIDEAEKEEYQQEGLWDYVQTENENYSKLRAIEGNQYCEYMSMKMAVGLADLMYFGSDKREKTGQKSVREWREGVVPGAGDLLGNNLTYMAAGLVTGDLIAEYGIDTIIGSLGSFEEDFGMTSDEYIQNYLDNKLYMHYLEEG